MYRNLEEIKKAEIDNNRFASKNISSLEAIEEINGMSPSTLNEKLHVVGFSSTFTNEASSGFTQFVR